MMFDKLKRVRDGFHAIRETLKKIPVVALDGDAARDVLDNITALDEAIDDLDDAMVADIRAERYARTLPTPYDITTEYLAMFAGSATTGELCA